MVGNGLREIENKNVNVKRLKDWLVGNVFILLFYCYFFIILWLKLKIVSWYDNF